MAPSALRRPTDMHNNGLYQEIVDNALLVTGSRYVHIALLDSESQVSRIVAWNYAPMKVWRRALHLVEGFLPGFSPARVTVKVDPEKEFERVYHEEKSVVGPLEEMAAGIVDPRVIRVAATLGRVHYVVASPVCANGQIVGAMVFGTPRPVSDQHLRRCEAFVRQVGLTLEQASFAHTQQMPERAGTLEFGDLRLDPVARQVTLGGSLLRLTPTEYDLLEILIRHPGRAFSRDELAREVWRRTSAGESNYIDVAVLGLRRKLEINGRTRIIQAVRGHGYSLRQD